MSTDKMTPTPGPWKVVPARYPENACTSIYSGRKEISIVSNSQAVPAPESDYNAEAIVSAINNTYGAGINPEAVPDLLQAIKELKQAFIRANKFYSKDHEILGLANAAIEKAKL